MRKHIRLKGYRFNSILGIFLSGIFVVGGINFLIFPPPSSAVIMRILIGILTLSAIAVFAFFMKRMLIFPLALRITDVGFLYRPFGQSSGLVHWAEVESFKPGVPPPNFSGTFSQGVILVELKDPERYLKRFRLFQRQKMEQLLNLFGTPLVFDLRYMEAEPVELLNMLNRELELHKQTQVPA